ncbi:MAG: hypothetical protein PHY28_04520 [Dehalococcoidales bacterium]|nr:hypothetical protein [Dehalococcoidales bacterium]
MIKIGMTFLAGLLCLAVMAGCVSNNVDIKGTYRYEKTVYMNPLSSWYTTKENAPKYVVAEMSLTILQTDGTEEQITASFEKSEVDVEAFAALFMPGVRMMGESGVPDISGFKQRYQYSINERYRLYVLDGETWLAFGQGGSMWGIYQLVKTRGG